MTNTNIITIGGTDYQVKPGMKAIIVFEQIADKPFEISNTTDMVTYFYAAIIAGNPGTRLTYEELLDALDDDPDLIQRLSDIALKMPAAERIVQLANEGGPEPKKG